MVVFNHRKLVDHVERIVVDRIEVDQFCDVASWVTVFAVGNLDAPVSMLWKASFLVKRSAAFMRNTRLSASALAFMGRVDAADGVFEFLGEYDLVVGFPLLVFTAGGDIRAISVSVTQVFR